MNREKIVSVIGEVFKGLEEGGLLGDHMDIHDDVVLLGPGALLDSLAFVSLFADLEERLTEMEGREIYLLLDEFEQQNTVLTIATLVNYIDSVLSPK
ncbi:MAG: hypothetical protein IJ702_04790 [Fretibacterium sp.]|nr:hypothetical protein [Fretibacterium sp.]